MSGIMVDMDAVAQSLWTKDNDAQLVKTLVQQVGMMTSAWEHRIPELLFTNEENPGEAVSAVKALALASAQGQRIYQVTSENVSVVLPQLTISSEVKDEIQASIAVGKVATVSQNNITVGGWTGVGYIIADPETGAGAYRISGGSNGGTFSNWITDLLNSIYNFLTGPWAGSIKVVLSKIASSVVGFIIGIIDTIKTCWESPYFWKALSFFFLASAMFVGFWGPLMEIIFAGGPLAAHPLILGVLISVIVSLAVYLLMRHFLQQHNCITSLYRRKFYVVLWKLQVKSFSA